MSAPTTGDQVVAVHSFARATSKYSKVSRSFVSCSPLKAAADLWCLVELPLLGKSLQGRGHGSCLVSGSETECNKLLFAQI